MLIQNEHTLYEAKVDSEAVTLRWWMNMQTPAVNLHFFINTEISLTLTVTCADTVESDDFKNAVKSLNHTRQREKVKTYK